MSNLPWSERVPMLSINPHAASVDDISRLASELMEVRHSLLKLIDLTEHTSAFIGMSLPDNEDAHRLMGVMSMRVLMAKSAINL